VEIAAHGIVGAGNGALTISGISVSTGSGGADEGVLISGESQVQVTGTGAITITGTSGQGSGSNNVGVDISKVGTEIVGSSGGISITGIVRSSGAGAFGVGVITNAQIEDSSTGSVSVVGQAPGSRPAIYFATGGSGIKVATGNVTLTGNIIDLGDTGTILSTTQSGTSHLAFQAYTHGRAIVVGSGSDASNALTFTNTDLDAIAQGGTNYGFGLITIGSAGGANPMSLGGAISFGTNLSLQAQGGLTLQVPSTPYPPPNEAKLIVQGILNLNNDPLHLIAPTKAAVNGAQITMIHPTGGTSGTTFLGLPQGSYVTDTAGHYYTISYTGNGAGDVVLTATTGKAKPANPGAGSGRGRGA
jgi:hypothetical protein